MTSKNTTISFEIPDLQNIVTEAITTALSPEKVQEKIQTKIEAVVERALDNMFSYHGDINEGLKDRIKEAVGSCDLSNVYVPDYTNLIMEGAKQAWAGVEDKRIVGEAEEMMAFLLRTPPKNLSLVDIVKAFAKQVEDDFGHSFDDFDRDYEGEVPTVSLELSYEKEPKYPTDSCLSSYKKLRFEFPELTVAKSIKGSRNDTSSVALEFEVNMGREWKDGQHVDSDSATLWSAVYTPSGSEVRRCSNSDYADMNVLERFLYTIIASDAKIKINLEDINDCCEFKVECSC